MLASNAMQSGHKPPIQHFSTRPDSSRMGTIDVIDDRLLKFLRLLAVLSGETWM